MLLDVTFLHSPIHLPHFFSTYFIQKHTISTYQADINFIIQHSKRISNKSFGGKRRKCREKKIEDKKNIYVHTFLQESKQNLKYV